MAVKYVRSTTGSDSNGGTSWADAYATVAKALSTIGAGGTAYVSQAHAETQASTMTWTSPGTTGNPSRILCVNDGATPPTTLSTGASATTTGANNLNIGGYAYIYGMTLTAGNSLGMAIPPLGLVTDTCTLACSGAAAQLIGQSGSSADTYYVLNINTIFSFASTAGGIVFRGGYWSWQGTVSAIAGAAVPTTLVTYLSSPNGKVEITGVDLSASGTGKNLISGAFGATSYVEIYLRNCKLGASVTTVSGTIPSIGSGKIFIENADSGNTNYRMEHYKYQGKIITETTVVLSGGASDGTTTLSHKFVSLTTGPSLFAPLEGPWMNIWNDTTGSSKTVTVQFLHDSLTNLQNSDIYLQVEGLGTSSFPESIYYNNRVADVFATPADCPAGVGTGSWTTTGITHPNSQQLAVSFTPQVKGPIRARMCLVKTNYTVYVNPVLVVS